MVQKHRPPVKSPKHMSFLDKKTGKLTLKVMKGKGFRKKITNKMSPVLIRNRKTIIKKPTKEKPCEDKEKTPEITEKPKPVDPSDEIIKEDDSDQHFIRRSDRKRKEVSSFKSSDLDQLEDIDDFLSDEDDEYVLDQDSDFEYDSDKGKKTSFSSRKRKRSKKASDPTAFDLNTKGLYKCWVCRIERKCCITVKNHIIKAHPEDCFCAVHIKSVEDKHCAEVVLFCPRDCRYCTTSKEALEAHMSTCSRPEIKSEESHVLTHQQFLDDTYESVSIHKVEELSDSYILPLKIVVV